MDLGFPDLRVYDERTYFHSPKSIRRSLSIGWRKAEQAEADCVDLFSHIRVCHFGSVTCKYAKDEVTMTTQAQSTCSPVSSHLLNS